MARLGDLCDIRNGYAFKSDKYVNDGVRIIRIANVQKGYIEDTSPVYYSVDDINAQKYALHEGDLLISLTGNVGRVGILTEQFLPAALNQRVANIVVKDNRLLDKSFLFHLLNSDTFENKCIFSANGVAQKNLSTDWLKEVEISLPPIDEQRKIAAVLDKISDLTGKRRSQLDKLDELVKSRFVEMFGGISNSKKYPYKPVKELTKIVSGGTPNREIADYWEHGTIKWVKTTELQNNIIYETEECITNQGLDNSSAKLVPEGTVLIAMYGQGKTRGMTGYLGVKACTNQACACILPSNNINQKFLWQFFMLSYDNLREMGKGGNQPNLNSNIIKDYLVLYPPMKIQEQFVMFLAQADKSKSTIQRSLSTLETLKKSLMQEYFSVR